jgi:hypothetical protein
MCAGCGQFPDVAQDRVAVPASDVVPVGGYERIPLAFGESEPRRLEGGDEVVFRGSVLRASHSVSTTRRPSQSRFSL